MGKRRFIKDPSKARHFQLVHSSQHDDEKAGQMTLQAIQPLNSSKKRVDFAEDIYGFETSESHKMPTYTNNAPLEPLKRDEDLTPEEIEEKLERLESEETYFPLDGYNYSQHLRKTHDRAIIKPEVPKTEQKKAIQEVQVLDENEDNAPTSIRVISAYAPQDEEEAELFAALDEVAEDGEEAGYFDVEDDFLEMLGDAADEDTTFWGEKGAHLAQLNRVEEERQRYRSDYFAKLQGSIEEIENDGEYTESEMDEDDDSECEHSEEWAKDEVLEKWRQYEDPRLVRIINEDYAHENIGELESDDEAAGNLRLEDIEDILDDFIEGREEEEEENMIQIFGKDDEVVDRATRDETIQALDSLTVLPRLEDEVIEEEPEEKWDCETILTTKSNISNHPGKILLVKKKPKLQALKEIDEDAAEAETASEDETEKVRELPEIVTTRLKTETKEEKKARKQAVKEHQRICREMKKETKMLYRTEDIKMKNKYTGTGDVHFKSRVVPM